MLGSDEMRAWYGPNHVQLAAERGAIGTLLISDELFRLDSFLTGSAKYTSDLTIDSFRASDPEQRKKYVALTEDVQAKGGEVLIFSSMHESGQRKSGMRVPLTWSLKNTLELNQLTGIAAILTFPLDVEVVEAEEKELKEEEERRKREENGETDG